jgi:hypothetical protein
MTGRRRDPAKPRPVPRPATIVDGYALFHGGHVRKLTDVERRLHATGDLYRVRRHV